jgi:hypothetical protein
MNFANMTPLTVAAWFDTDDEDVKQTFLNCVDYTIRGLVYHDVNYTCYYYLQNYLNVVTLFQVRSYYLCLNIPQNNLGHKDKHKTR